jgi:hypothetical protein
MPYILPITDRAQSDIDNETSKGYFNISDWERIHGNTETAKILISILLNTTITQNIITHPVITTIPTVAEINLFIQNINLVRTGSGMPAITGIETLKEDWQAGRSAGAPTFAVVNSWERVLDVVYNAVVRSVDYAIYCGVAAAGQPRFYQNRWRTYAWILPSETPVRRARTGIATTGSNLTRTNNFRRYE